MRSSPKVLVSGLGVFISLAAFMIGAWAQDPKSPADLDAQVKKFLTENRGRWQDWNVPYQDGQVLFDLIIKNRYKNALEIGTSTGHSAVWIAWALSKTGGKLITIEIDEGRYQQALKNFRKAGVESFIDARLANAHQLVKDLAGPFDFVFSDADKEWYTQYFEDVESKLVKGGCFTAHNVANADTGVKDFLNYIRRLPNYQTTIDRSSSSGISISYKK
jgi:predicted O-methyltransferase YrrM